MSFVVFWESLWISRSGPFWFRKISLADSLPGSTRFNPKFETVMSQTKVLF